MNEFCIFVGGECKNGFPLFDKCLEMLTTIHCFLFQV